MACSALISVNGEYPEMDWCGRIFALFLVLVIFVGGANKAFAGMVERSTEGGSASYAYHIDIVDKSHHRYFDSYFAGRQLESLNNISASKWSGNRIACLHLDRGKLAVGRVPLEGAFHRKATSIPIDYDVTIYDFSDRISNVDNIKLADELAVSVICGSDIDKKVSDAQARSVAGGVRLICKPGLLFQNGILPIRDTGLTTKDEQLENKNKQRQPVGDVSPNTNPSPFVIFAGAICCLIYGLGHAYEATKTAAFKKRYDHKAGRNE